jgi:SAM-dependent methyltransferase
VHTFITIFGFAIIGLILVLWFYPHKIKPYLVITNLRRRFHKTNNFKTLDQLLESLYSETNSHRISTNDRDQLNLKSDELTYGEIVFLSFMDILARLNIKPQEIFYDLGSGSGKAMLVAALNYDFAKARGIELLPGLITLANKKLAECRNLIQWHDKNLADVYQRRIDKIEFVQANIFDVDISDATLVFINATCFTQDSWDKVLKKFTQLPPGARIFMTTKTVDHPQFNLLFQEQFLMSWGLSRVSAYEKVG